MNHGETFENGENHKNLVLEIIRWAGQSEPDWEFCGFESETDWKLCRSYWSFNICSTPT